MTVNNLPTTERWWLRSSMVTAALVGIYLTSFYNYLLFHALSEFFAIIVAGCIFVLAWNGRHIIGNNYLLILGIACLFIGLIDLVHTLAYPGMGIIKGAGGNLATQLWIIARYMESLTFFFALFFLNRKAFPGLIFTVYALITAMVFLTVFYWELFPVCFIETTGLTPFKIFSEYVISILLLISLVFLLFHRDYFAADIAYLLTGAILTTLVSELAFSFYRDVYGFFNLLGHLLKVLSFYLLYKAVIETVFLRPYSLLFADLKRREQALEQQTQDQAVELAQTASRLETTAAEKTEIESLYRRVGDLIPFGLWICDLDGRFLYLSDSFWDMLGEKKEEMNFSDLMERLPPESVENTLAKWRYRLASGEIWDHEMKIRDKTGRYRTILSQGIPFYDKQGNIIFWGGINLDVTERETLRAVLENERQRFYFVLEKLPAYLFLRSSDYTVTYANRYFKDRFGEPGGKYCYTIMYGREKPCERCTANSVLKTRQPFEWDWLDAPDNRIYHVYCFPFTDIDGSPMVLEMGVDITERVASENRIRAYSNELEEKNRELRNFAYVASHDLQEPLRKISSFGSLLRTSCGENMDEKGADYLQRMENAAKRMRNLISALLSYSRVSTQEHSYTVVDLNRLIDEVIGDIDLKRTNARVTVESLIAIEADSNQMYQLFQNLILNAVKFNDKFVPSVYIHGKTLDYSTPPATSRFVNAVSTWYQILIEDNGIGMEQEYFDQIFLPFQRLHTNRDYEGTGIGLSICKKIIEQHGGSITVKSQPGEGTTFVITFPLKQSGTVF